MGLRKTILATGEWYHVFNRSSHNIPLFKGKRDHYIFSEAMKYYLQPNPPTRFSIYKKQKSKFPLSLKKKLVKIVSFCFMPNHLHFALRQEMDNGIRQFMQRLLNSYAHYYNLKYQARGHVFEGNFKAVHIETEEQLIHLSRYIHLNPVTAFLIENPEKFPYSSYKIYLNQVKDEIIDPSPVMENFNPRSYREFILDQKDYQRKLDEIKHLVLE